MVLPWMPHGSVRKFTQTLLDTQYPLDLLQKQVDQWVRIVTTRSSLTDGAPPVRTDILGTGISAQRGNRAW